MLSYEEALARVLEGASRIHSERIPLVDAAGRVLADDVAAPRSIPELDYSAMDGYAVSSGSFLGDGPWTLDVAGESRAGTPPARLAEGRACRIFTGAPIPTGSDAVVMQEEVTLHERSVHFSAPPNAGAHIRRAGEDLKAGQLALREGTRLTPYQLGLLAALNHGTVVVASRPRVTIVCTGDELTLPGETGPEGSIPESNGVVLASLARHAGANVVLSPLARDNRESLVATLRSLLLTTDVLITVGGVSVGDYDFVQTALTEAGGEVAFWKVAIKPGKPLLFGRAGRSRMLGLPGNPASAQVTFTLFGLPLLRKLQGDRKHELPWQTLPLKSTLHQRPGRRGFYAFKLEDGAAAPLANQASGAPTGTAWADGLLSLPAEVERAEAGSIVHAILWRDLGF